MAKKHGCKMEFVREDDYVEYFVFPQLSENSADGDTANVTTMHTLLAVALDKSKAIVEREVASRNYIWHKDEFQLQIRTGSAAENVLREDNDNTQASGDDVTLPPHLHGVTHFGDNITDEWFVVHLLCQITCDIAGSIARVIDSDGEFVLIEAADVLPEWANPDTCEQRVYIRNGGLVLVQNSPSNTAKLMSVAAAVCKIRQNPTLYRVSKDIQECINIRLKEFSGPNMALHRQIVRLPLAAAALLQQRPSLIASAVRAFCDRDPIDLKVCRTMRHFPPEQRVRSNILFTRCLYAMAMHSNYVPDRKTGWNLSGAVNTEQYKEDLLGIKIACGLEILASQAKQPSAEDENDPAWRTYLRSLTAKGYFRDNLEGSAEYKRLLAEAKAYHTANNARFRTASLVGTEILEQLRTLDVNADQLRDAENNLVPSESDDWLNISAEQLDALLLDRYGPKKLYKSNGDINAEEFTRNIAEFLEKESQFEGIDGDGDDDGDDDDEDSDDGDANVASASPSQRKVQFRDKVKKSHSMRKACKRNSLIDKGPSAEPHVMAQGDDAAGFGANMRSFLDFVIPEDKWDSNSEMSDYGDEDDLERNFEAMGAGADDADILEYMAQMDKELSRTTIGQTFERTQGAKDRRKGASTASGEDDFDDIEAFEPININVNTLKNMMDSYKSQMGGAGPVSNLLSAMGVGMAASDVDSTNENRKKAKDLSESTV